MKKKLLLISLFLCCFISKAQTVTTLAGSSQGYVNATGTAAKFTNPLGICYDSSGNLYVADSVNHRIRKVTPAGVVSTFVGSTEGDVDGTGTSAHFSFPAGICMDSSGNLYTTEWGNNKVRKITPAGVVTTLAGNAASGFADGPGNIARFNNLHDICCDSAGNLYVADTENNRIRKITPDGVVSTLAGSSNGGHQDGPVATALFSGPRGICSDSSGNLYTTELYNGLIRKITPAGIVSTIAGSYDGFADGTGTDAQFSWPESIAIDTAGYLYVSDTDNQVIRKITPAGVVTTLAGSPENWGYADGTGNAARFYLPEGICVLPSGVVYVTDTNHRIRKISSTLSVNEPELIFKMTLYPNPATEILNIEYDNFNSETKLSIADVTGKEIYSGGIISSLTTVNIKGFSKGVYFVNISNGIEKNTKKIIIQ